MRGAFAQGITKEKLKGWWRKLLESLPFMAFFVVLFFTVYELFGVADALIGIAFLFFSRTIVQEPGLSFANYARRVSWFFIMAMCATLAALHPVASVLGTAAYLFAIVLLHSDDYLPRNFYWLGMGYLLLMIYPATPADIGMRALSSALSIGMTTIFVVCMRRIYRKIGKIDEFARDREYVRRAFDDVGNQLRALSTWGMKSEAGETEGDVHPKKTFAIVQGYARMEYPTVFRQGGLLSGRQRYTFALLLCAEQVSYMASATLGNIKNVKIEERRYFEDLSAVFLDYGRGHIWTVSQMVTRLRQFIDSHELDITCHEESWRGILEAMLRTLKDTRLSRDRRTPFADSVRYRLKYLRENFGLKNTQTRFALQMAILVGLKKIEFVKPAEAVIFDCDGTLLDSMPLWHAMERSLASRAGITLDDELIAMLNANTLPQTVRYFHHELGVGSSYEALLGECTASLFRAYQTRVKPKPGARELVFALHERGIPMAVASSSPMSFLQAGLQRSGILPFLQFVSSADSSKTNKRDPAFLRRAAWRLDAPLDAVWVIDDSPYALAIARSEGMRTLGVLDSEKAGSFEELCALADVAVYNLGEIDVEAFTGIARPLPSRTFLKRA